MSKKKKSKSDRMYFTQETEDAIVRYNETEDPEERDLIYREHLEKPFDKMAESIINRFKFPYVNNSFEETKNQVISFICMNLWRYSKDKGKAFSYFSVIAKNYLILHNNKGHKHLKRSVSISESETRSSMEEVLELDTRDPEELRELDEFMELMLEHWEVNIPRMFKNPRDVKIANAILELFRRAEHIENFNKKALYLLIREQTDCKTSYITKVVNKMQEHLVEQRENYKKHGVVGDNTSKFFEY